MNKTLSTCLVAMAALLAAPVFAGDAPRGPAAMKADTDGDGRISRAEAEAASAQRNAQWFDKVDSDNDGYVTTEELNQARKAWQGKRRGDMKAKMDKRFSEADVNGDGKLSLDEAQAKMPKLAERFSALDADKDGLLSKEELARGHHRGHKPQKPQT